MTDLPETIAGYLAAHHVMSLAVAADGDVWAASAFYCWDGPARRLLNYTSPATRHGRLSLRDSRAAATISDQERDVSRLAGLQLEGSTALLDGDGAAAGRRLFADRFPEVGMASAEIWALHPTHVALTDNARGFGDRLEWRPGPSGDAGV